MVAVNPETSVIELQNSQGFAVGQLQAGVVSGNSRKRKHQTKAVSESGQQWATNSVHRDRGTHAELKMRFEENNSDKSTPLGVNDINSK